MYNPSELCRKLVVPRDTDQRFYPDTCRMMPERETLPALGLDSLQLEKLKNTMQIKDLLGSCKLFSFGNLFMSLLRQAGRLNAYVRIALSVMNEL